MKGIGLLFFASGAVYVMIGMLWGLHMGSAHDFTLAPAHAHLNLVGFVTMSLMGIFYHLTPRAAASVLSRLHFGLATLGVWVMVPGIAVSETGGGDTLAIVGSLLTAGAMVVFLINPAINVLVAKGGHVAHSA